MAKGCLNLRTMPSRLSITCGHFVNVVSIEIYEYQQLVTNEVLPGPLLCAVNDVVHVDFGMRHPHIFVRVLHGGECEVDEMGWTAV